MALVSETQSVRFNVPLDLGHFGDKSFQAINCTTNNNETQHHMHPKHNRETEKLPIANKTILTLIWYAFCDCHT